MSKGLRGPPACGSRAWRPAAGAEITNSFAAHRDPLGNQQRTLERRRAAVAAETPGSSDHTMTRNVAGSAGAHDVPDRARRPRPSGNRRHVAVSGHPPRRNAPDRRKNARGEIAHGCRTLRTLRTLKTLRTPENPETPVAC